MEINTAVTIGFVTASYFFIFGILAYYAQKVIFKKKVNEIHMFMSFSKPLYSYTLRNNIKVKFGYLPLSSYVNVDSDEDFVLDSLELKKHEAKTRNNNMAFQAMVTVLFLIIFVAANFILGNNTISMFQDFGSNIWELMSGKQGFSDFMTFIHSQYDAYGKYFFIVAATMMYFIFIAVLMIITSLSSYLAILLSIIIIVADFLLVFKYFELPLTFYIDIMLSLIISGFIYFLLLRFFIK
ncbi:hypothetical protein [Chryseobacterium shigense]|uniref:Uncharacterized protein n=1 Tax=Chryseobacterium shigense TaxID=297244 RepID=A0A841NB97_9FLAO|nr:hypothetical protein [Chryseobacterium shigense]MBB6372303.1 hypothetical protein [Chryseobacterium shigense]